jgi:hypothetical protein
VIEIRSYRRVFDLERRVYSVDRLRLNPGGIPVRGVVYLLALVSTVVVVGAVPVVGAVARLLPWYLRDLVCPCALATVLSVIRIEGRTFHLAAHALVCHRIGARRLAAAHRRAAPARGRLVGEVVLLPDGSDARMRRLRYTGPGAVLITLEHERRGAVVEQGRRGVVRRGLPARVVVRERDGAVRLERGEVISLSAGARLLVRPHAPPRRAAR